MAVARYPCAVRTEQSSHCGWWLEDGLKFRLAQERKGQERTHLKQCTVATTQCHYINGTTALHSFPFTLDHESVTTLLLNHSILSSASIKVTMCLPRYNSHIYSNKMKHMGHDDKLLHTTKKATRQILSGCCLLRNLQAVVVMSRNLCG